jgi:ABC-type multidrug transport system ATPase subunit
MSPPAPPFAIDASRLRKAFGPLPVLRDLDLQVGRGETLAILGPNGAGKSTLLRILACVSRPAAGSLRLFDGECYPRRPGNELLARIGFVGHEPLVYRDLTPRQNLEFTARLYRGARGAADARVDEHRIAATLSRVGLAAAAERPTRALSRGLLQRLALGRATLHEPELLLLDEPFTGLDESGGEVLVALLRAHREAGGTAVLVSHDFERVARLAGRIVILARGRVALDSPALPASELLAAYRSLCGGASGDVGDRS